MVRPHPRLPPWCFYPRHPCGWRRTESDTEDADVEFLSTPPVWVATFRKHQQRKTIAVSIHATRVGGDSLIVNEARSILEFLSTPPVWVATEVSAISPTPKICFYPRHPCGWRHRIACPARACIVFLSTPPVWVATCGDGC